MWNNNYAHRASPNTGKIRRRVLKISFQNNYFQNSFYPKMQQSYHGFSKKDEFTDFIFGKFHHTSIKAHKIDHLLKDYKNSVHYNEPKFNTRLKLNSIFNLKIYLINIFFLYPKKINKIFIK